MPKKYTHHRRGRMADSKEPAKSNKPRINMTDKIICTRCGQFSGWTNDDLKYISGEREIKCQNCKKPCIQTFCKNKKIN